MAERVGKKRATVANYLRLLKLPAEIQMGIQQKKIDMGHARALAGSKSAEQQLEIYKRILAEGLSVRKVEQLVSNEAEVKPKAEKTTPKPETIALQKQLTSVLGTQVKVVADDKGKGKISIAFKSAEEMDRILRQLNIL